MKSLNKLNIIMLLSIITTNILQSSTMQRPNYGNYNWNEAARNTRDTFIDAGAVAATNGTNLAADAALAQQIKANMNTQMGQNTINAVKNPQNWRAAENIAAGAYNGYINGRHQ
jgi:hypothetical protein